MRSALPKEFVREKFCFYYNREWASRGKTDKEFAEEIRSRMPGSNCDKSYISKWRNGVMSPVKYLPIICEILEVDVNEFDPRGHDEKYKHNREYQSKLETKNEGFAADVGVNVEFLYRLRSLVDFNKAFPVYTPLHLTQKKLPDAPPELSDEEKEEWIEEHAEDFLFPFEYARKATADAADAMGRKVFQIRRDGKTITLSRYDVKFLKHLQDGIVQFVYDEFERHKAELETARADASKKIIRAAPDGDRYITRLSPDELQEIDPWGIYTRQEAEKWKMQYQDASEKGDDNP